MCIGSAARAKARLVAPALTLCAWLPHVCGTDAFSRLAQAAASSLRSIIQASALADSHNTSPHAEMSAYAQEDEKQPVAARSNVQFVPAASIAAVYPPAPNANAAGAGLRVNAGASPAPPADMRDVDLRRSNTGSLPPTRVGSPRVGGAGYDEDDDGFPISPPSQQPQQQQQQQRGGAGYVAPTRPGSASTVQRQPSNLGGYPAPQQHQQHPQHTQHPHPQAYTAASPSPTPQASHHSSLNLPPRAPMPGPETRAERLRLGIKSRHGPDAKGKTQSKFAACFGRAPPTPSAIWGLPLAGMLNPHTNGLPAFIEVSLNLLEHSVTSGTVSASALFQPKPCSEAQLQDLVNFLEENHETGEQLSEAAVGFYGCAAVGAFVLRWLDHLPEPLMTTERYHQFLTAANATPSDPAHPREIVAPGAGGAGGPGINRAFRSMFPFVAQANSSGGVSEDDQIFIMQSLLQSLHPAHYKLLQRMILLFRRMLQASMRGGGAASPGSALTSPSSAAAASLVGGVTNSTSVSLQRLAHLFSSIFLFPPASSLLEQRAAAIDYHRPQEQQVLIYLVQHYEALFLRHPVHLLHALPPPVAALDPNPALLEVLGKWRTQAGNLKVKFGRAQFDKNALTRAFRAWRGESKSNRRVSATSTKQNKPKRKDNAKNNDSKGTQRTASVTHSLCRCLFCAFVCRDALCFAACRSLSSTGVAQARAVGRASQEWFEPHAPHRLRCVAARRVCCCVVQRPRPFADC